ncbi:GL23576 [Drosophila persimilis]|uniref:GL23576 n=1 Tax=Drosophila persimilis TaxID=7234 RepID=B4G2M7_DROPE|nr:GL23576 [Drosophila persimilis]
MQPEADEWVKLVPQSDEGDRRWLAQQQPVGRIQKPVGEEQRLEGQDYGIQTHDEWWRQLELGELIHGRSLDVEAGDQLIQ